MNPGTGGTVRWGVLGASSIARTVIGAVRGVAGTEFVAVASRSEQRARAFADEVGVAGAHGSYAELLADDDVDAVYVALPISLHADWSVAALEAGKHVLCEKPLAPAVSEVERAHAAADRAGRHLVEGFMYRHHPQTLLARQLVADGALGRVTGVRAALSVDVPEGDVRRSAALGGGASLDLGCYCVHAIRTFGGEVEEVAAQRTADRGSDVVDLRLAALARLSGGALATFDVGLDLPRRDQLEVVGTEGRLEVPDPWLCRTGHLVLERDGRREVLPVDPQGRWGLTGEEADAYRIEVAAVSRQLREGPPDPADRRDAVAQAAVLDAVRRAASTGAPVRLGPAVSPAARSAR